MCAGHAYALNELAQRTHGGKQQQFDYSAGWMQGQSRRQRRPPHSQPPHGTCTARDACCAYSCSKCMSELLLLLSCARTGLWYDTYTHIPAALCLPHEDTYFAALTSERNSTGVEAQVAYSTMDSQQTCVNITTVVSSVPPPLLSRCWSQRGIIVDLVVLALNLDGAGQGRPTGYSLSMSNVSYLCEQQLSEACVSELGPLDCFLSQ